MTVEMQFHGILISFQKSAIDFYKTWSNLKQFDLGPKITLICERREYTRTVQISLICLANSGVVIPTCRNQTLGNSTSVSIRSIISQASL
jgi:hypothetical protein